MAARSLPTAPSWSANQEITSALLNQISTYMTFWANPPSFRAEQHTPQNVSNGTATQITCETLIHDSDSGLSTVSPFSYTVPFAGIWDFDGGVGWAVNTTGFRIASIYQNGTVINGSGAVDAQAAEPSMFQVRAPGVPCQVGDVITLWGYQNSGSPLATGLTGFTGQYSFLAGRLISLQTP